jgi:hypothetical protein
MIEERSIMSKNANVLKAIKLTTIDINLGRQPLEEARQQLYLANRELQELCAVEASYPPEIREEKIQRMLNHFAIAKHRIDYVEERYRDALA